MDPYLDTSVLTPEQAVREILAAAYADSLVLLDEGAVMQCLTQDGAAPTRAEAWYLITGDDDGDIPPDLAERFPALHLYLEKEFS